MSEAVPGPTAEEGLAGEVLHAPLAPPRVGFPWRWLGVLLALGLLLGPALPRVSARAAVEVHFARFQLLHTLPGWPGSIDPWGQRWRRSCVGVGPDAGRVFSACGGAWGGPPGLLPCGHRAGRYSFGPNGEDEQGAGDDLLPRESLPAWLLAWIHSLPCAALAWALVLRRARQAPGRELGWGELGWALAVGLPPAALCWTFVGWASGAETWEDLFRHTSGLLGWQTSLTLTVSGLVFLAAWGLSRPRRAPEDAAT